MLAKDKLQNRDQIDILEEYLGNSAHHFAWDAKGLVKSKLFGPKGGKDTPPYKQVHLEVRLENYPSNEATIIGTAVFLYYATFQWTFVEVPLSNPVGLEFFRKKIASMLFVAINPHLRSENADC